MDELSLNEAYQVEAPDSADLGEDEIHVWAVPLVGDGARFEASLSEHERDKARRYRFVDHRRRYAIAHGAKRAILAGYTATDPAALQFELAEHQKPRLVGHDFGFNVAHSGKLALIAIRRGEIGVDIEKARYVENLLDIARRNFSAVESAALERCCEEDRLHAFYRCWTRKEAFVKALGSVVSVPLRVFDVSVDGDPRFLAFRDGRDPLRWGLWDVSPAPGYVAAVAAPGRDSRVVRLRLKDGQGAC